MEKDWCVECWGEFADKYGTDIFYTEKEAKAYFTSIRKKLDSTKYLFTKDSIIDKEDADNAVYLTNLSEIS